MYSAYGNLTVDGALRDVAAQVPANSLIEWEDARISYGEFDARVSAFANGLRSLGIRRGAHVLVRLSNCPDHLVVVLGLHRAGCVYVACSTLLSPNQVAYQFDQSDTTAVVCSIDEVDLFETLINRIGRPTAVISVSDKPGGESAAKDDLADLLRNSASDWTEPPPLPDELASVLYTSGTTGRPKGVMWTHGFFYSKGRRAKDALEYATGDRMLHFFPLAHSNGGSSLVIPLILVRGTIVMVPRFSASRFVSTAIGKEITVVGLNATHAKMIMAQPETDQDSNHGIRRAQFGLHMDPSARRRFTDRFGIQLVDVYGMTECGIICAAPVWANHTDTTCGPPLAGVELRLIREDGQDVTDGSPGEILVRGNSPHLLSIGYYKDPDATKELVRDGWMHTQDLGRMSPEGYLIHAGRINDTIKRAGYNVSPAEIERVLTEAPGIANAAVVGIPDEMREAAIVAYVVPTPESKADLDVAAILAYCSAHLAAHQVPQHIEIIDVIPESILGKTDTKGLRDRALAKYATVGSSNSGDGLGDT